MTYKGVDRRTRMSVLNKRKAVTDKEKVSCPPFSALPPHPAPGLFLRTGTSRGGGGGGGGARPPSLPPPLE